METKQKFEFSVIIPALTEQEQINVVIEHVCHRDPDGCCEIIVVDGDPAGSTINAIEVEGIIKKTAPKGRGRQMNVGAVAAKGDILIFLHADTRLPDKALEKIGRVLQDKRYVGGAFDLGIDSRRLFLKYIAVRASQRSRLNRIPYGDQAIFIRKSYFEQIGGFKEIPLMEDVDLMRRIKKDRKKIYILSDKVMTSARRWERDGALYTTLKNQILIALFYLGVSPDRLAKYYRRHSNGNKS
jgi:rSAM/selenodomain-associated transferase 2